MFFFLNFELSSLSQLTFHMAPLFWCLTVPCLCVSLHCHDYWMYWVCYHLSYGVSDVFPLSYPSFQVNIYLFHSEVISISSSQMQKHLYYFFLNIISSKNNCFTILHCSMPYINMNQPQGYTLPLPPEALSHLPRHPASLVVIEHWVGLPVSHIKLPLARHPGVQSQVGLRKHHYQQS